MNPKKRRNRNTRTGATTAGEPSDALSKPGVSAADPAGTQSKPGWRDKASDFLALMLGRRNAWILLGFVSVISLFFGPVPEPIQFYRIFLNWIEIGGLALGLFLILFLLRFISERSRHWKTAASLTASAMVILVWGFRVYYRTEIPYARPAIYVTRSADDKNDSRQQEVRSQLSRVLGAITDLEGTRVYAVRTNPSLSRTDGLRPRSLRDIPGDIIVVSPYVRPNGDLQVTYQFAPAPRIRPHGALLHADPQLLIELQNATSAARSAEVVVKGSLSDAELAPAIYLTRMALASRYLYEHNLSAAEGLAERAAALSVIDKDKGTALALAGAAVLLQAEDIYFSNLDDAAYQRERGRATAMYLLLEDALAKTGRAAGSISIEVAPYRSFEDVLAKTGQAASFLRKAEEAGALTRDAAVAREMTRSVDSQAIKTMVHALREDALRCLYGEPNSVEQKMRLSALRQPLPEFLLIVDTSILAASYTLDRDCPEVPRWWARIRTLAEERLHMLLPSATLKH